MVVHPPCDDPPRHLWRGKIDQREFVTLVGALRRRDEQPVSVIGDLGNVVEPRAIVGRIDQAIVRLIIAEPVEIDRMVEVELLKRRARRQVPLSLRTLLFSATLPSAFTLASSRTPRSCSSIEAMASMPRRAFLMCSCVSRGSLSVFLPSHAARPLLDRL